MEPIQPTSRFWNGDTGAYLFPMDTMAAMSAGINPYANFTSVQGQNGRIACNVESCVYHSDDNHCTASGITVGPENARQETETLCATYRHK